MMHGGHVIAQVVGPFHDLGSDVHQEGIGGPAAQEHDAGRGVVHQEERHGCPGTNGGVAKVFWVEAKGPEATGDSASGSEKEERKLGRDVTMAG